MLKAFLLNLALWPLILSAQGFSGKHGTVYLDETLKGTTKKNAVLQGTLVPTGNSYLVQCYYDNGRLMYAGTYADKKLQNIQGTARYYHTNGVLQAEGMMENNQKTGIWRYWYDNKQIKDSGNYVGGYLEGTWIAWHHNGALKSNLQFKPLFLNSIDLKEGSIKKVTGSQLDGLCNLYHENGNKEAIGEYDGGRTVGKWEWNWQNGMPSTIEYYDRVGKLDSMRCYDSAGKYQGEFCSIDKPAVLKGYGNLFEHISSNFRWPDSVSHIKKTATVKVSFTVNLTGRMEKLRVESTERILAEIVHRFIKQLPDWYPAISHNREISWTAELKIPYIPATTRTFMEEEPVWNGPPLD